MILIISSLKLQIRYEIDKNKNNVLLNNDNTQTVPVLNIYR